MDVNGTDDTKAIAAGLARWYQEAMTESERRAFHGTALAAELRHAGFEVQPPATDAREADADREVSGAA